MKRRKSQSPLAAMAGMVAFLLVGAADSKGAEAPVVTEQNQFNAITRAVFAAHRLWLLQDDGSLRSLAPEDSKVQPSLVDGKILEICKSAGEVSGLIAVAGNWSLQSRAGDRWTVATSFSSEGDTFVSLSCGNETGQATVVTNRRLVELRGNQVRSIKLHPVLREPLGLGTALETPSAVWIGFNVGEWGGGLRRISRIDGTVAVIESNKSGELCGGPLNTGCDPVSGIVTSPWNKDCVIAAIGLVHMMSHGRLIEVCDRVVRRLYFKTAEPQPPHNKLDDGEPASTVAFFGLARSGDKWWAVGFDGLYRFDGARGPEFSPLPKFENKSGYWVSFDEPGLALVLTDVNQRRAMSGSVPIMADR